MAVPCEACGVIPPPIYEADPMDIDQEDSLASVGLSSSTSTHPSSTTTPAYYDEFNDFADNANAALEGAYPIHRRSRNSRVGVLLLLFEDDELGVLDEIQRLHDLLRYQYDYETEIWAIPSDYSDRKLSDKLYEFRNEYCPRNRDPDEDLPLLIVYYGGHAAEPELGQNTCIWASNRTSPSAQLDWTTIQPVLFNTPADVLLVLDCCYASSATWRAGAHTVGSKETITACGPSSPASGVGERSFTSALISELKYQAGELSALTVVALHGYLLQQGHRLRFQPTYARSHRNSRNSTSLNPIRGAASTGNNPVAKPPRKLSQPAIRVLLAVHIRIDPNVDFVDFLSNSRRNLVGFLRNEQALPTSVTGVQVERVSHTIPVEGVYKSTSTLVLVSVPLAVWHLLPDHRACRFVSFVTGPNLLVYNTQETVEPFANEEKSMTLLTSQITSHFMFDAGAPFPEEQNFITADGQLTTEDIPPPYSYIPPDEIES